MLTTSILLSDSFVISIADVQLRARARQLCASQRYMSILAWAMGRYMRSHKDMKNTNGKYAHSLDTSWIMD